jgi:hypothetical protein
VLGPNTKKYVCILSITNRLSHTQIQNHLKDIWSLHISIGEIGNILETEANNVRPVYENVKQSVLSQTGTHYDETSWKVQKEEQGKYAWVATGTENNDTVFSLGRSRGKGNIQELGIGKVGISDDYGAYKNSFEHHQLCWAHPYRKLRDMAESGEFDQAKKKQIRKTYEQFSNLYRDIQKKIKTRVSPYPRTRFQNIFHAISKPNNLDPGWNYTIKDRKLYILANNWLEPIEKKERSCRSRNKSVGTRK